MANLEYMAKVVHRALEIFARQVQDESTMMEIADIYPEYAVGKAYQIGDVFRWGVNADGEAQLYQVLQAHTSAAEWKPDEAVSLYKKIGVTPAGYPVWTQPYGATDAYQVGDIVSHNDRLWICTVANNVWEPGVYGWDEYEEE